MEDKEIEKYVDSLHNKFGTDKMNDIADILTDFLIKSGDKKAYILKEYKEINKLLHNLMDSVLKMSDKEFDETYNFILQIKQILIDYRKEK